MEDHAIRLRFLRNRSVCRVPSGGVANGFLACHIPAMGTLVEGGKLCAMAGSRVGWQPSTVSLGIQNSRHWDGAFRCYCGHSNCVDSMVPITGCSTQQTNGEFLGLFGKQNQGLSWILPVVGPVPGVVGVGPGRRPGAESTDPQPLCRSWPGFLNMWTP
jgi:hypothetical protein